VVYLPDAEITHLGSQSVAQVRWKMLPRMVHSHWYVVRKHLRRTDEGRKTKDESRRSPS
jgi:hypothetical protein